MPETTALFKADLRRDAALKPFNVTDHANHFPFALIASSAISNVSPPSVPTPSSRNSESIEVL